MTTNPVGSSSAQTDTNTTNKTTTDPLANKDVFLQMLVAQIKNQDPLKPTDGAEFMSQLAQFSSLEQLVGMRQNLTALVDLAASQTTVPTDTKTPA